jgi:hypothetical protein
MTVSFACRAFGCCHCWLGTVIVLGYVLVALCSAWLILQLLKSLRGMYSLQLGVIVWWGFAYGSTILGQS